MVTLAVLMSTLGLLISNVPVIIGSMLVAPLLSPILSFSLGIVLADVSVVLRSGFVILKSFAFSLLGAMIVAFFVGRGAFFSSEILSRAEPSFTFFFIAFLAGLAGSFSYTKSSVSALLPGVAISVSLIPPISVLGIGMANLDQHLVNGSALLFLMNIVGIVFASMIVFSMSRLGVKRRKAVAVIKKEDKEIAQEKREVVKKQEQERRS